MTASFELDAAHGGRLASLTVGSFDLIYNNSDESPTGWGAYPMVPYAGRVDEGRFAFSDSNYQLEVNQQEHAMHGNGFTSVWERFGPNHLVLELDDRWPLGGTVSHRAELTGDQSHGHLKLELAVAATGAAMPAMVGWHPWFNRQLSDGGPSADLRIVNLDDVQMYELGDNMIPTGRLVSPPEPGPWDHPFRSVSQPISLVWQDQLAVELESSCDHWVIYNRPEHAFCVEPQSGPPDIFNSNRFDIEPTILQPGEELAHTFTISWTAL